MKEALVLFAHGSRDPAWQRPFKRLRALLKRRGLEVRLAYLEITLPSLEREVAALAAAGTRTVRIVPLFLGAGRHLKRDLARKAALLRKRHQSLRIAVGPAIGEQPRVIAAMAAAIAAGIPSPRGSGRRS